MRVTRWAAILAVLVLACQARVSEQEVQRPLDALPDGACMVLVGSDLADIWRRAETNETADVLRRVVPENLAAIAGFRDLRARLHEFESSTGTNVRDDIVFNILGGRVAVGAYPTTVRAAASELLFVAELQEPERFRQALEALRRQSAGAEVEIEEVRVESRPALRLRDESGVDVVLLQEEGLLVLSTAESLVPRALDVHAGQSEASALRDPACSEALDVLGPQRLAVVSLGDDSTPWTAQGFTWGTDGVRFKRIVRAARKPRLDPVDTPLRREEILGSVPTGMMLTYYARPTETDLLNDLLRGLDTCFELSSGARGRTGANDRNGAGGRVRVQQTNAPHGIPRRTVAAAPLGLDRLPFDLQNDVLPWAGDEMAFVLAELVPTGLVPIPSAALIVEVAEPETAERTLLDLESSVVNLPLGVHLDGFVDVSYGGKTFRSFGQPVLETVSPSYLIDGDVAILTTTRELMQYIVDTRRVGRGQLLGGGALEPFGAFVPENASAALFADQRRLLRALEQLATIPRLWGEDVARAVEILDGLSVLFARFPAGALYLERTPTTLTLNAWMLEKE